jgi:hypothetical protein
LLTKNKHKKKPGNGWGYNTWQKQNCPEDLALHLPQIKVEPGHHKADEDAEHRGKKSEIQGVFKSSKKSSVIYDGTEIRETDIPHRAKAAPVCQRQNESPVKRICHKEKIGNNRGHQKT